MAPGVTGSIPLVALPAIPASLLYREPDDEPIEYDEADDVDEKDTVPPDTSP